MTCSRRSANESSNRREPSFMSEQMSLISSSESMFVNPSRNSKNRPLLWNGESGGYFIPSGWWIQIVGIREEADSDSPPSSYLSNRSHTLRLSKQTLHGMDNE